MGTRGVLCLVSARYWRVDESLETGRMRPLGLIGVWARDEDMKRRHKKSKK